MGDSRIKIIPSTTYQYNESKDLPTLNVKNMNYKPRPKFGGRRRSSSAAAKKRASTRRATKKRASARRGRQRHSRRRGH